MKKILLIFLLGSGAVSAQPIQYIGLPNNTVEVRGKFVADTSIFTNPSSPIGWINRSKIVSPSDGNILFTNNAGTNFTSLQFGSPTSSFPSLARNGSEFITMLADGSGSTKIQSSSFRANNGGIENAASVNNSFIQLNATGALVTSNKANADVVLTIQNLNVSSPGNLLSIFSADGTNRFQITSNGNILGTAANSFGIGNLNSASGANSFGLTMPSGGATMSRNVNDAMPTVIMLKNQGTGLIQDWRFGATLGTSVASIDINGYISVSSPTYSTGGYTLAVHNTTSNRIENVLVLSNTATLDFPSTAGGATSDLTITLTGAALGDAISLGTPFASVVTNTSYSAFVSSANTVTVRLSNTDPINPANPASGTFKVVNVKY